MAEELVMNVKSNIKGVTQETKDWNKSLDNVNESIIIQNKVITDLEKDLIKLKAQQDAIPKGAFFAGMGDLNKKIKETSSELKLEKLALKELNNEQKEARSEVKKLTKAQKEQNVTANDTIGNFQVMGVSLNGIKKSIGNIIPLIKLMFKSFTAGLLSTGLGAFVVAFGSLVTYVTSTKAGMDKLNVTLASLSAKFNVLKDRFSTFGEAVSILVTKGFKGFAEAAKVLEGNLSGIGSEMEREAAAARQLALDTQALRDADNEFMIQKALTRKEIEKARLLSEDESKSAQERLESLSIALDLEQKTTDKELELARERMRIFKEEMELNKHKAVDEQKLAELTTAITTKEIASLRLRKRVMTEINEMQNQINAERESEMTVLEKMPALTTEINDTLELANNKYLDSYLAHNDSIKKSDDAVLQNKLRVTHAIGGAVGALSGLLEEGSSAAKAAALTEIAINTGVGLVQGLDIAQKSAAAAGPAAALAFPLFYATQVAAVLGAASQAKQILGAGGGGVTPPSTQNPTAQTPAPQMMSGSFDLTGGVVPEPTRAYVVTDEMTNSQNQLANIRRRATI